MIWVDRVVKDLKNRKKKLEWVDDMKTPSGRIHVGSLRGVLIHDLVYKVLVENNINARFTWVFEDHDPMDAIPSYLDFDKWEKYAGMPLYKVPSPEKGFKNFAEYYALEFQKVFEALNCHPEILWMSQIYKIGKMNGVVKDALDNADKIRKIYKKISKVDKPKDWYPFNVICENCGKIGTTYVYKWDGKVVSYRCVPQMVAWAKGCGHEGKISPYDGNGKMPWRVEWPAKWKVIGVTVEGGGKDHMSSGGSHDMASVVAKEIFKYPVPYPLAYEFITIGGGRKMSSSLGTGTSATEFSKMLPPELGRFLIVRAPIHVAVDFDPQGETILNLFDDYDRCVEAYFRKIEHNIPDGKEGEVLSDFARIIELSQVRELPKKRLYLPRFRTIVNLLKTKTDLVEFFETQKGNKFTKEENSLLKERVTFAKNYLKNYAAKEDKIEFIKTLPNNLTLSPVQKEFLILLSNKLEGAQKKDRDEIQTIVFDTIKSKGFQPKEVFKGFYRILIGRDFGPKASDLIIDFGIKKVTDRIKEVV